MLVVEIPLGKSPAPLMWTADCVVLQNGHAITLLEGDVNHHGCSVALGAVYCLRHGY